MDFDPQDEAGLEENALEDANSCKEKKACV